MAQIKSPESKAGVGSIEGAFYTLCSALAWVIYDGFVLVCTLFVVSATRIEFPWRGWAFVAGMGILPLIPLAVLAVGRVRSGSLIPTTPFSRTIFWVQVAGVAGLIAGIVTPPLFLWSYLHSGGELRLDNPTEYAFSVSISIDQQDCYGDSSFIKPRSAKVVDLRPQDSIGLDCWGIEFEAVEFSFAYGTWTCAWPIRESQQPVVFSDSGPSCETLSFEPSGINPPVSPPASSEPSPLSPPPAPTPDS